MGRMKGFLPGGLLLRTMSDRRSEIDLFRALERDGDAADLAEFSDRLRRCVHWVLNRMAGGSSLLGEVEELVGEARLRLEQLRGRGFNGGAREFRTYLYKVVVSVCVEARNARRWVTSLDAPVALPEGDEKPLGEVVRGMIDPALAADAGLERAEVGEWAQRALARMDERCRHLLRRFHVDEVPIRELAREQGTRLNTIEVALTRCRSRLYAAFLSLFVEGSDGPWKERVANAAGRLSGNLGRIFRAWWTENRSVIDISKEIGLAPVETKRLLGEAKLEVWRLLAEAAR